MASEPNDLLCRRAVGDLQRMAVGRAPDGLHHVPEIEATFAEVDVAPSHDDEEHAAPGEHRSPDGECPRTLADEAHGALGLDRR